MTTGTMIGGSGASRLMTASTVMPNAMRSLAPGGGGLLLALMIAWRSEPGSGFALSPLSSFVVTTRAVPTPWGAASSDVLLAGAGAVIVAVTVWPAGTMTSKVTLNGVVAP